MRELSEQIVWPAEMFRFAQHDKSRSLISVILSIVEESLYVIANKHESCVAISTLCHTERSRVYLLCHPERSEGSKKRGLTSFFLSF